MILVTGGFGFIGSSVVRSVIAAGERVLVVDDLTDSTKLHNLVDVPVANYVGRDEFATMLVADDRALDRIEAIVHLGARTDTTESDGSLLFELNYRSSCRLLDFAERRAIPLVYASSAAVYGRSAAFGESPENERPLNAYAHSKLVFDNHLRERIADGLTTSVIGLRFFNVYGPGERHKGTMASVVRHFHAQAVADSVVRPFGPSHGYAAGRQERDFVHVDDVVAVIRWALDTASTGRVATIANVGTGESRPFAAIADLVAAHHGHARIEYRDFPASLAPAYQPFTRADLGHLRALGCPVEFRTIDDGVPAYLEHLDREQR